MVGSALHIKPDRVRGPHRSRELAPTNPRSFAGIPIGSLRAPEMCVSPRGLESAGTRLDRQRAPPSMHEALSGVSHKATDPRSRLEILTYRSHVRLMREH